VGVIGYPLIMIFIIPREIWLGLVVPWTVN